MYLYYPLLASVYSFSVKGYETFFLPHRKKKKRGIEMKRIVQQSVVSAFVIGLVVWIASLLVPFSYIDWSFFIGLGLSVIFFLFNSSGGPTSKGVNYAAALSVFQRQEEEELKTDVGGVFFGSVLYTLVSFITMIFVYF